MVNIIYTITLLVWAAWTTFIPRLIPLLYVSISGLLLTWTEPFILSLLVRLWAIFGAWCLWFLNEYLDQKLKKRYPKFSGNQSHWLGRKIIRLHHNLHIVNKKWILFFLVTCTTRSAIPDILIIRTVRQKLSFPLFLLAVTIGKLFVYTPFIYGMELLQFLPSERNIFR